MKTIIFCLSIFLLTLQGKAQQTASFLTKYPKSVQIKIYEILQKVNLTDDKQRVLAETYLNRENELADAILKGVSKNSIETIKAKYELVLRKGLTANEIVLLNRPDYSNDGFLHNTSSKFYSAYKRADELKLSKNQVDSVLANGIRFEREAANFVSKNSDDRFDAQGYENRVLPRILSEQQYNYLFTVKFKESATSQAINDWSEAKKRGLTGKLDSATVVPQMIKYTVERKAIGERFRSDPEKRNNLYAAIDESVPDLLSKLKYARRYGNPVDDKGNVSKNSY